MPHINHSIKTGASITNHAYNPGTAFHRSGDAPYDHLTLNQDTRSIESSIFIEDDMHIGKALFLNVGIHGALFSVEGKRYSSLQPRLSAHWQILEEHGISASFTEMNQFTHLLAPSGLGTYDRKKCPHALF